jgi:NADH-quinone oxidoreductase subunit G
VSDNGLINVTINGTTVQAEKGRLLIDLAEEIGVFVPRFCYHPGMKSVAVCRMCLVKVEGQNKLLPACATPVDDGMVVETASEDAVDAQEGMLEFLLINHPLDCPVCDRGGECPLQDQTYRHGPGSSRYVEPKRTFEKPIAISELVMLDRERCVLCWRCVRFADEIAGDRFIQLVDRGDGTQILNFKDEPFDSYFSGNTVQICPVGALTSKPYRFVSRPWDLETSPSVCGYCSVGCPITNEARSGRLVRCQALPNENVNDFWICDKGRYGYHYVSAADRLTNPIKRNESDEFEETSWGEAYSIAAEKLQGKEKVGVIAGGHLTTEDAFAIARVSRKVIGTPHIDSRIQDAGAPYDLVRAVAGVAGSNVTINELEEAGTIVWAGPDPKEALPVLYLRLRKAVLDNKLDLITIGPRATSLDHLAARSVRVAPGQESSAIGDIEIGDGPVVVVWGPSSPGRDESQLVAGLVELARANGARMMVCPPHAGSQGLIDMGVLPTLGPAYEDAPAEGKDTRAILEAAVAGEIETLVLFGADLLTDFPDHDLARRALESNAFVIAVELFATDTVAYADLVLPSAAYAERDGTFTNLERRLQKLEQLTTPPGSAREPWKICDGFAAALGQEWGWRSCDDVWDALRSEVKSHSDVKLAQLSQEALAPAAHNEPSLTPQSGRTALAVAGPGGQYPKGHRQGAPFQTGQNWPLSWELRAFEAKQRPGFVPAIQGEAVEVSAPSTNGSAPDDDSFALIAGRMIYDEGSMVSHSASLRGIARKPFVEVSRADAQRLEVSDGDPIVLTAGDFAANLPVVVGDIAEGCVFVPYHQDGLQANQLMQGANPRVTISKDVVG